MRSSPISNVWRVPSAPESVRRKRRYPGAVSIHAILMLVACGSNPFQFRHHGGQSSMVEAMIVPLAPIHSHRFSHQKQQILQSRVLSESSLSATSFVHESTRIKGQITPSAPKKSTSDQPKKRKTKQRIAGRKRGKRNPKRGTAAGGPWNADFATSIVTQRRIQSAAHGPRDPSADPLAVSRAVLDTLLDAPTEECNAANLVCALTLSSKTLSRKRGGRNGKRNVGWNGGLSTREDDEPSYRTSLVKTLSVLQTLVEGGMLTPRQLCNSAWAVAKHVEHDQTLYLRRKRDNNFEYVKDTSTWDLREDDVNVEKGGTDELIDEVLNSIALRVTEHLEDTRHERSSAGKRAQPGELCMLLWAYAAVKPRDRPPGWERSRRVERLSNNDKKDKSIENDADNSVDFVTFMTLRDDEASPRSGGQSFDDMRYDTGRGRQARRSVTSELFDAAAIAFCQGEGAAVMKGGNSTTLLRNCTWNELANVAWSYAARGACGTAKSEAMMSFLAKEATRRIRHCTRDDVLKDGTACDILPRDVIQIAWALGTMESDNVNVGDALIHLVDAINEHWISQTQEERPLAGWTCPDLVQMATALAHGRLDNPSVLFAVYEESLERLTYKTGGPRRQQLFTTAEVSVLLWVQARMYLMPKFGEMYREFPRAASRALLRRMEGRKDWDGDEGLPQSGGRTALYPATTMRRKGLGPQEQANLAWSLTVLENYDDDVVTLLQNIFHAASSSSGGDGDDDECLIQLEHAHQLWQSYFLLSHDRPDAVRLVPMEFAQYLEEKWNAEKGRRKSSSSRHTAISRTLDLMGVAHRNEVDEDVDVAIVLEGDGGKWTRAAVRVADPGAVANEGDGRRKVAVEFDGPHHFTVAASTGEELRLMEEGAKLAPPRVLGHTVLKYRLLKKKGWTVVRIPYYEFDKIPFWASMERQRYLQRALKTHDKIEFSGIDISEYKVMPPTRHSRFD